MIADAVIRQRSAMNYDLMKTRLKVCFTHFKSYERAHGKFWHYATFCVHGTTLHGMKFVGEIKRCFIKRLIT